MLVIIQRQHLRRNDTYHGCRATRASRLRGVLEQSSERPGAVHRQVSEQPRDASVGVRRVQAHAPEARPPLRVSGADQADPGREEEHPGDSAVRPVLFRKVIPSQCLHNPCGKAPHAASTDIVWYNHPFSLLHRSSKFGEQFVFAALDFASLHYPPTCCDLAPLRF